MSHDLVKRIRNDMFKKVHDMLTKGEANSLFGRSHLGLPGIESDSRVHVHLAPGSPEIYANSQVG